MLEKSIFTYKFSIGFWNQAPMKVYNVIHGYKYRFRVINPGTAFSLRISIDQHDLHMIATDGYDTEPLVVESFFINPGERFDFYIEANQPVDNYYIRADSLVVSF